MLNSVRNRISIYQELSKSGIVTLVLISVFGGYLIGQPSESAFSFERLLLTLAGVLLVASGSSALNQLQERAIDAEMPRTAKRPLPSGRMSVAHVIIFVAATIIVGIAMLARLDPAVCALGALAIISYNGFYTMWWKKRWPYAAIPGAVPGALPILMGYAAASREVFAPGGVYLFFMLFFWQMPHFWVLAIRFKDDYAKGKVPTLPVAHGEGTTRFQITLWCLGYIATALMAPLFLHVGMIYILTTIAMSGLILWELRHFILHPETKNWLRFFLWVNVSLIVYIGAAAADLWSVYLLQYWIR